MGGGNAGVPRSRGSLGHCESSRRRYTIYGLTEKSQGTLTHYHTSDIYAYIEKQTMAKGAWKALEKTFDGKGLSRKVNLLAEVSSTKLKNRRSMEDYVSRIVTASQKVRAKETQLPQDLIGALLLTGLLPEYKLMIMALSSSGKEVITDLVELKLLE